MIERAFDWRTKVIAIDFDGCLCRHEYPKIGEPNWEAINEAKRLRRDGACLILWTCRAGKELEEAVEACRGWGLEFDAINENPQFRIDLYGGNDCRKIGADEYWDDQAVYMGFPDSFRSIRGTTICTGRGRIREFIDVALRGEIEVAKLQGQEGTEMVLRQCMEYIEGLIAALDDSFVTRVIQQEKAGDPG